MRWIYRFLTVVVLGLASAAALSALVPAGEYRLSEDRNRDGHPDIWRVYDRHGNLVRTSTDTNFDGRSDVRDYYDDGVLVRRESDRDFNNQVDLVVEFDRTTREEVRSVVDMDFDGRADVLTLVQAGRTVFSETAPAVDRAGANRDVQLGGQADGGDLIPLDDPFRAETSVRAIPGPARCDCSAWSNIGGALASNPQASALQPPPTLLSAPNDLNRTSVLTGRVSPRGPPNPQLPN